MNVLFCGTLCSGKSTVIDRLLEENPSWVLFDEVVRRPELQNELVDEDGSYRSQLKIMDYHISDLGKARVEDVNLFDRGVVDAFVFALWARRFSPRQKEFDEADFVTLKERLNFFKDEYSPIFFCEPEFELVDDGFRSKNPVFRTQIHNLFLEVLEGYSIPFIKLTGSVDSRLSTVYQYVRR